MAKVLIVEDHPIFRRGLKEVLAKDSQFRVIGEAADAREAWDHLRKERWDAVVLDINLPGKSGLELLTELKQQRPELPKLILSAYPEDQYAMRMLRAGASGYLTKDRTPEELVKALTKLLRGEKYISDSLAERLVLHLEKPGQLPHESLSDREFEVMKLIVAGKAPREIAGLLHLSPRTVNTYRSRVLQKLKMKNNAQLIHYAIENKLLN
jgi:two-component system, NarL family, invasion response regulator UvrY